MHWDNTNGAGINTDAEESVWNEYVGHKVRRLILLFLQVLTYKHSLIVP